MEENENESSTAPAPQDPNSCLNCGNPHYEDGYANKLCTECRDRFAKFPIPKWIILFAIGIAVLVIVGMCRIQAPLMGAIHLKRGVKAARHRKYVTAARELEMALAVFPESIEGNGYAVIADYYNMDTKNVGRHMEKLSGKKCEDNELLAEVNQAITDFGALIPKDSILSNQLAQMHADSSAALDRLIDVWMAKDSDEQIMAYLIANKLYETKQYTRAEKMLGPVLEGQPRFAGAIALMTALKRQQGRYDEALALCDQQMLLNVESVSPYAQKARIELKRKNDIAAQKYMQQALALEKDDLYTMETLAIIDFYTGKKQESQKILAQIREKEKPDTEMSTRLENILTGKEIFR